MNEQFSKLLQECIVPADQAIAYSKAKGLVIPDEKLDVAKLAELIVRECIDICLRNHINNIETISAGECAYNIQEHFGVE